MLRKLGLSGALLVAAAGGAHGQGSIVYHNPGDVLLITSGGSRLSHPMDLNTDGTVDFVFEAFTSFQIYSTTGNRSVGIPIGVGESGYNSIPLLEGFPVGGDLPPPLEWATSVDRPFSGWIGARLHTRDFTGGSGYWNPPVGELLTAYVGVEFGSQLGIHYGWIRVTVSGVGNGGIIHDWAYNALPGQPILAGQVPEPGTWALLLIGAGLLSWRTWRKGLKT